MRAMQVLAAIVLALGWTLGAAAADAKRPNIVIFLSDDEGYGELGCQGNKEIPTPHIDSIAAGGIPSWAWSRSGNCSQPGSRTTSITSCRSHACWPGSTPTTWAPGAPTCESSADNKAESVYLACDVTSLLAFARAASRSADRRYAT